MKLKVYVKDVQADTNVANIDVTITEISPDANIVNFTSARRYRVVDLLPSTYSVSVFTKDEEYVAPDPITLIVSESGVIMIDKSRQSQALEDNTLVLYLDPKIADGPYQNPHLLESAPIVPVEVPTSISEDVPETAAEPNEVEETLTSAGDLVERIKEVTSECVPQQTIIHVPPYKKVILYQGKHSHVISGTYLHIQSMSSEYADVKVRVRSTWIQGKVKVSNIEALN